MKSEVPDGWKKVAIGKIITENNKSKIQVNHANNTGKYKFFTSGEAILRYDEWLVDGENLFMATGGVANVNYYNSKCSYSTDTYSLKSTINTKFVYYLLLLIIDKINYSLFEGTGLKHLQKPEFKEMRIAIPNESTEQGKIVDILQMIDDNIEKTKVLINKNRMMKKGLMLNLINKGLGGKRKKVLLGKIWKKIKRGPSLSTNLQGKGVVYLTSDNLTEDNHLKMSELKHLDNVYNKDCVIEFKDVIINCVNSEDRIGKTAFYDLDTDNVIIGFNNFALTFNGSVDSKYMYYHLSGVEFQRQVKQRTKPAVNQVSFSGSDLFKIDVEIPADINEQQKIVEILDSIDNEIIKREIVFQKLQKIKSGLMQDLLTGKVRVAT